MSHALTAFDTLKYANKLKNAGVPAEQAEVQAEAMKEQNDIVQDFIDEKLATKDDLKRLKYELIICLGGITTAGVVVLGFLMALFKFV